MTETVTIEKQVWEATLRASMERAAELQRTKSCLEVAENLIKELGFGYQSRKQYNKLISAARFYFENKTQIAQIKESENGSID